MDANEEKKYLMLVPSNMQLFPVSEIALNYSQNSKKNLANTVGSLLIDSTGKVKKIHDIKRLGFFGNNFVQKLKSFTFGVYSIKVDLEEESLEFNDLKKMISEYVKYDLNTEDSTLDKISEDTETLIKNIESAESVGRIFEIIYMPDILECLDAL